MKNVTITLDEKTADWLRVQAAQNGKSVSRMVGEMLQERMQEGRIYQHAMRRYLARQPVVLKPDGAPYPSREALYDRQDLR